MSQPTEASGYTKYSVHDNNCILHSHRTDWRLRRHSFWMIDQTLRRRHLTNMSLTSRTHVPCARQQHIHRQDGVHSMLACSSNGPPAGRSLRKSNAKTTTRIFHGFSHRFFAAELLAGSQPLSLIWVRRGQSAGDKFSRELGRVTPASAGLFPQDCIYFNLNTQECCQVRFDKEEERKEAQRHWLWIYSWLLTDTYTTGLSLKYFEWDVPAQIRLYPIRIVNTALNTFHTQQAMCG